VNTIIYIEITFGGWYNMVESKNHDNKDQEKGDTKMSVSLPSHSSDPKEKRPCTPAESVKESLKEMKLMREGKMKKQTWDEYVHELRNNTNKQV
jgi:hypothetical protein